MFFDDVEEIAVAFQPLLLEIALIQKKNVYSSKPGNRPGKPEPS